IQNPSLPQIELATISRFDLPALTKVEWTYPSFGAITDLQVAPGAPHTLAISFTDVGNIDRFAGVVVSVDAVVRPNTVQGGFTSLTWGFDSTVLLATGTDDFILSVDSAGAVKSHLTSLGVLHRDLFTRRFYSDSGAVFDANGQAAGVIFFVRGPVAPD